MPDVMLDLETLGTRPGCVVLSIGAVAFNQTEILSTFSVNIDARTSQRAGLRIEADTVMWWMGRDEAARQSVLNGPTEELSVALLRFNQWLVPRGTPVRLWSKGPSFDAVILRSAYIAAGMDPLWDFRNERCVRTILDLAGIDGTRGFREDHETRHDAAIDALVQARAVQAAMRRIQTVNPTI